jgi:hypothetical protein
VTRSTFIANLLLATCMSLGLPGCPETMGGLEEFGTDADDFGDLGDSETGDYVDPDADTGYVAEGGELGETGETGDDTEPSETGETGDEMDDACGDFAVQAGEECDGWNTNFETCLTFGFIGGELSCNDDCTFDESACVAPGCGNGIIETVETCDGTPYPCWLLGYAGSTDTNGMTPCQADCTPNAGACIATCEWGQPGCFCDANAPCGDGYLCMPHPQNWENAPGTCELAECQNVGTVCDPGLTVGSTCCPGLDCVDSLCV